MSIFDKGLCVSGWTASRNFCSGLKNEPPHIGKRKRGNEKAKFLLSLLKFLRFRVKITIFALPGVVFRYCVSPSRTAGVDTFAKWWIRPLW